MIERDRVLLARAIQLNQQLGAATVAMLDQQDGGELPAGELRAIGEYLHQLGLDMISRANELAGGATGAEPVVIDGHRSTRTRSKTKQ